MDRSRDYHSRDNGVRRRTDRSRSRSPFRRERSRSPYRPGRAASGEKRKNEGDHYTSRGGNSDPRRQKPSYENKAPSRSRDQRSPSYEDRGNRGHHRNRDNRSPPRGKAQNGPTPARNQARQGERRGSNVSSVSERESTPKVSSAQNDTKSKMPTSQQPSSGSQGLTPTVDEVEDNEPPKKLTDAEIIEQRRKKREAIKAKHKSHAGLLVQALEHNMPSDASTPGNDTSVTASAPQSPSSSVGSPSTPYRDSSPASPAAFAVENDEDLANHNQGSNGPNDDEGPSAADYDPNMDMQEDRPDHKRQDMPQDPANGVAPPVDMQVEETEKPNKEFDMFGDDDDDDDMFAPTDKELKTATTKAAKTLDQGLLDNWDYPDGHYRIILGELLDNRYAVQEQIGKGTFATVVRAEDTKTGKSVAVKIACNNDTMFKAGQKEAHMLNVLNESDPEDKKHIIRMERDFIHKGHLCLVFENLSADLREVLKKFGRNIGISIKAVRSYAHQMFHALSHMKKCEILHADLKPDNILVNEKRNLLKVCDLGTAAFANDAEITPYLVSRFYRAPEVIMGMPFDYAIDMWSIGCTLFELATGRILFAGADNNQMLRVIQECRGKLPIRLLKRSSLADHHFDFEANFISQERDKITGNAVLRPVNFNKTPPGKDLKGRFESTLLGLSFDDRQEHNTLIDLLDKCLQLDPAKRISPSDALRHQFVAPSKPVVPAKKAAKPMATVGAPRMK